MLMKVTAKCAETAAVIRWVTGLTLRKFIIRIINNSYKALLFNQS